MQLIDREEFDKRIETLCAGYNIPPSVRPEAYWLGLQRMSIVEFARLVEWALAEDSPHPDKIPTVGQFWGMKKNLRNRRAELLLTPSAEPAKPADERDHLLYLANRMFLRHAVSKAGLGSPGQYADHQLVGVHATEELVNARKALCDIVEFERELIANADPEACLHGFVERFTKAIDRVSTVLPSTAAAWASQGAQPHAHDSWSESMSRRISA